MDIILFDVPLLVSGFLLIIWARFSRSEQLFQLSCLFVSTFAAQYTLGVSWSLAKLIPILSASSYYRAPQVGMRVYLPFVVYVCVGSLFASFFWEIPAAVAFWYGDGRLFLQLFNFLVLVASCVALAGSISDKNGARLLVIFLHIAALIHGVASIYQLLAANIGLPLIGISRAHDLTADDRIGDIALFLTNSGEAIYRPAGLMGEPKTAAVLFGIVLMHGIYTHIPTNASRFERLIRIVAILLSAVGFLAAFSTSAFVGFSLCFIICIFLFTSTLNAFKLILKTLVIGSVLVVCWNFLFGNGVDSIQQILFERTFARSDDGMDPPVEASINAMIDNPLIAIFGIGQGGSSFLIMNFIGQTFEYAYAANIGIILLLVESGLIGTMLLLGVFAKQIFIVGSSALVKNDYETQSLFIVGLSTMLLSLAGSGMALGYPLAVACLAVAARRVDLFPQRLSGSRNFLR